MSRAIVFLFVLSALLVSLPAQVPFSAGTAVFKDSSTLQEISSATEFAVLQLEASSSSVSSLGEGWAVAIPQFWVTPAGHQDLIDLQMTLPSWVMVMDPTVGMVGQSGATLLNEFAAKAPSFTLSDRTESASRHIGHNMMRQVFGNGATISVNDVQQAAQYMSAGAAELNWLLTGVPGWASSSPAADLWDAAYHASVGGRDEAAVVELARAAAVMDAPSESEGLNFIRSPEFNHLWATGALGVSVQFVCLRNEEPETLESGGVSALLSDPAWITPASSGGSNFTAKASLDFDTADFRTMNRPMSPAGSSPSLQVDGKMKYLPRTPIHAEASGFRPSAAGRQIHTGTRWAQSLLMRIRRDR